MTNMRAVMIHEFGESSALRLESAPVPQLSEDQVLVRVHATSINPVDEKTRAGKGLAGMYKDQLPAILGWDVSGVVEDVGANVANFKPGDEVYGMPLFPALAKTYADYMVAPASEFAKKPKNLPHSESAALPLVALTAHQAFETISLKAGETILIHAAAGGVGHIAVQLAKARGAKVIGTASSRNHEFLKRLGVDELIDYTQTPFETVVKNVDAVFDCVGGDVLPRSYAVVRSGGRLVTIAGQPSEDLAKQHGIQAYRVLVKPDKEGLEFIAGLVEKGQVKPVIQEEFMLEDIARAHDLVAGGHVRGKVVVRLV